MQKTLTRPSPPAPEFALSQFRWDPDARTLSALRSALGLPDTFAPRSVLVRSERTGAVVEFTDRRARVNADYSGTAALVWRCHQRRITVVIWNDE